MGMPVGIFRRCVRLKCWPLPTTSSRNTQTSSPSTPPVEPSDCYCFTDVLRDEGPTARVVFCYYTAGLLDEGRTTIFIHLGLFCQRVNDCVVCPQSKL